MNGFRFRPESTTACIPEELTGFDVHPFAFAAGAKGEDKSDQLLKGELACTGKIFRCSFELRIDILGDKTKKTGDSRTQLAWFFKAGSVPS
jgi:hypothetical protein